MSEQIGHTEPQQPPEQQILREISGLKSELGFTTPTDESELGGLRTIILDWQAPDFEELIGEDQLRLEEATDATDVPTWQKWQIGVLLEIAELRILRNGKDRVQQVKLEMPMITHTKWD